MRNLQLLLALCLCSFALVAQSDDSVVIGEIKSIDSKILDEERKIWIYVPEGANSEVFEKKDYPVVYLLDGDAHFASVVGMIQQLSSINGNTVCPKMIVVGIPNTDRTRDLTPMKGKPNPLVDSNMIASSGGGENFMAFLKRELIPYVDANYPTNSYRMLIGHSFGGLTVLNALVNHTDSFSSYVSLDPSVWWGDGEILRQIKQTDFDGRFKNKSLFVGIANTMSEGMNIESVRDDESFPTEHIRALLDTDDYLKGETLKYLSYTGKYYADDDHGSVPLIATYDALRSIFSFYRFKIEMKDVMDPEVDLANKIVQHHERLSREFGKEIKPDEEYINGMGYQLMSIKQFKKAEDLLKLNVANYPKSFNVYDSLGDLYAASGEKQKAIENYRKSISLNKDSFSKGKLKALEME